MWKLWLAGGLFLWAYDPLSAQTGAFEGVITMKEVAGTEVSVQKTYLKDRADRPGRRLPVRHLPRQREGRRGQQRTLHREGPGQCGSLCPHRRRCLHEGGGSGLVARVGQGWWVSVANH
ncbi:MAG: hypothetical protein NBKEAIPA_00050 [Nitrospirae bacterium]|nr:MAG: hypothetical protein UZ03_NOB001000994 [Nitrospira sp. OLB3]MBV6468187.1 hypothetical protein [Nitrospirota bacterium]